MPAHNEPIMQPVCDVSFPLGYSQKIPKEPTRAKLELLPPQGVDAGHKFGFDYKAEIPLPIRREQMHQGNTFAAAERRDTGPRLQCRDSP